jgi:hypothetical protein
MPAYNFQKRWAWKVERRLKRQTIRAKRRMRPRVGQVAHCFAGMRTRRCRRLGSWRIRRVLDIRVWAGGVILEGGVSIPRRQLDAFARRDGFAFWEDMLVWFEDTHGLPFRGDLIRW